MNVFTKKNFYQNHESKYNRNFNTLSKIKKQKGLKSDQKITN